MENLTNEQAGRQFFTIYLFCACDLESSEDLDRYLVYEFFFSFIFWFY